MEQQQMAIGWAARDASGVLSSFTFSLRAKREDDITLKILYCGICHTDLSVITNEWGDARYPVVPGHEIVGVVIEVGSSVQKIKTGDKVGVGYMASSCLACDSCKQDLENYCPKFIPSVNSIHHDGSTIHGGFSNMLVINEHFAVRIPESLPLEKVAPLMCAGITVYSPLKHFRMNQPGKHLGVVGLGGLGHMAMKFGKAFGMKVTVISTSASKEKEAIERLGADAFLISKDPRQIQDAIGTMDGIIDTVSAVHALGPYLSLLKMHGKLIMVGVPAKPLELPVFSLIQGGKIIAGSMIGGMKDTQEMVDFAGEHGITPEVEVIGMDYVNTALKRLEKNDVRYRFVIDMATL